MIRLILFCDVEIIILNIVHIIIINILLPIFRSHCFIYIYFINRSLVVIIFIVWLPFENIKRDRVVIELVLIQQIIYIWSVHHNDKICTNIILLPMYYLFYFWISILWSHTIHCSKVFGNHYEEQIGKSMIFDPIRYHFDQYIIIMNIVLIIFCFHCFTYIYLIYRFSKSYASFFDWFLERAKDIEW